MSDGRRVRAIPFKHLPTPALLVLSIALCPTLYAADDREQLPGLFRDSYVGLSAGLGIFGFTDAQLAPNLHSSRILNDRASVQVSLGHYFTPSLALQLSLLRPIPWVYYQGVYTADRSNAVEPTLLALTVRKVLPLTNDFGLYGAIGVAYESWIGFTGPGSTAGVASSSLVAPLTSLGLLYRLSPRWTVDATVTATWPVHSATQPATRYAVLGLGYLLGSSQATSRAAPSAYSWPLQVLEFGFFDKNLFYWDAAKLLANGSVPVFFNGEIKTGSAYMLMYERNVFHTRYWLSVDVGVSAGRWISAVNREQVYTVAVFPAIRVWPLHSVYIDAYLTYSLAGPAYISRTVIDGKQAGGNFTFQDYVGIGTVLGRDKHFCLNLKLMHYSNGNLLAQNPGVATPVTLNAGYAW